MVRPAPSRSVSRSLLLARRGFTLIELLVVIAIIAIVAAIAIPSMTKAQFDRRVFTNAAAIGEIVREARTRAIGRGADELVSIVTDQSHNKILVQIYEAVQSNPSGGGSNVPFVAPSCGSPIVWTGANATANLVDQFGFAGTDPNGHTTLEGQGEILAHVVTAYGTSNAAIVNDGTTVYLCFAPTGKILMSTGTTANFTSMAGAVVVELTREAFPSTLGSSSSTNLIRTVWIPPTGVTRITSH